MKKRGTQTRGKKLSKIAFVMFIIAILAVTALAIMVRYHNVFGLDIMLSRDLQAEGDSFAQKQHLKTFLEIVSIPGRTFIASCIVVATAGAFLLYKFYREAIFTLLVSLASAINWLFKILINRPRPTETFVTIVDRQADASFPSGHTVFYTVFFGFLIAAMIRNKKLNLILRVLVILISLILIVAVSFSRVYLGAHWASDVLAGYLVGIACLYILLRMYLAEPIKPNAPAKAPPKKSQRKKKKS